MNAAANINLIKLCEDNIKSVKNISMLMDVTDRGDLNTSCQYPEPFMSDPTVLCERLQTANVQNCEHVNKEKFSLSYDTKTLNVTVKIRNVTEQDSGEYWCEASGQSGNGNTVYFMQINLTVTVSTSKTTQLSPSSTSPPTGFPASIVIPVSAIPLLLLIAFVFLIMILHRIHRMK
ncbi:polymeric immunoglobulin receptor-like isoform X4, partial [Clarias magur]